MLKRLVGHPWRFLNYGLAVVALGYVLSQLHLSALRQQLGSIVWWLVGVAILLDALAVCLQAFRWRYLLRPSLPPYTTVLQATYAGILFNEILPLRTGEVARGLIVARRTGRGLATVLSTEVVERVSDGAALAILAWVAIRRLHLPPPVRIAQMILEIAVATALVVAVLVALRGESYKDRMAAWHPRRSLGRRAREVGLDLVAGLRVLRDLRAIALAAAVAVLTNVAQVLVLWTMLRAYHIDLTVVHTAAVLAIISIGIFLPNTPGNVGPWQFFCVVALSIFGVDQSTAAGFSMVTFVILTLPLMFGGAVALASSPFTFAQLRHYPSADEPLGGALELVAEHEGVVVPPRSLDIVQRQTVDELLARWGYNSTAYLAGEGMLHTFLAPRDAGFIAYEELAGVGVALGEPIAAPENLVEVVRAFEAVMAVRGVDRVLFYGVSRQAEPYLRSAGYRVMPLGPEAVFYLDRWSLEGGPMKSVRHKVNLLTKKGAVVVEFLPHGATPSYGLRPSADRPLPTPEDALVQMLETSALWETGRDVASLGFTVSKPSLDRPGMRRYFVLFLDNRVEGFFTYEPIPARNGWYLDCERRRPDSPQGVTETLVAETHRLLRGEGATLVSWGTTALARPGGGVGPEFGGPHPAGTSGPESDRNADNSTLPSAAARKRQATLETREDGIVFLDAYHEENRLLDEAFSLAYRGLGFLYPYQGLYENKAKYHPAWEETYLAFRPRFGPRMAYAIVKAHHPEGVSDLLLSRLHAGRQLGRD
ncbi:MAG: flippase-like domain-containing protein [Actinobacteria bacterium]|nr:flippase-like domain-containing protein [Actinomycetota bacterium]